MMDNLLYLAKPVYGGWITYASHLLLRDYQNKNLIYKVGNKLENKARPFGFGTFYRNIPAESLRVIEKPIVVALDPNFYDTAQNLKEPLLIMHDTAEPKKRLYDFYHSCRRILVPRKTIKTFLKENYELESDFVEMPFYEYPKPETDWTVKTKFKNMARVEYRKHQDIICQANQLLTKKGLQTVEIHGFKNGMYVFQKLQGMEFEKWYKGAYPQDFGVHTKMLEDCKFLVDMTQYVKDGGGMQYTLLQAIYHDTALILNREWVDQPDSSWKEGVNCFAVSDHKELTELIESSPETQKVCKKARLLLTNHTKSEFNF